MLIIIDHLISFQTLELFIGQKPFDKDLTERRNIYSIMMTAQIIYQVREQFWFTQIETAYSKKTENPP
jgi:hypothetical protein